MTGEFSFEVGIDWVSEQHQACIWIRKAPFWSSGKSGTAAMASLGSWPGCRKPGRTYCRVDRATSGLSVTRRKIHRIPPMNSASRQLRSTSRRLVRF